MAKFTVNNVEFEYDLFDADKVELYENEFAKVRKEAEKALKNVGNEKFSKSIRNVCSIIRNVIDALFGDGKSYELFADKNNLLDIAVTLHKIETETTKASIAEGTEALQILTELEAKPTIKVTK